MKINLKGVEIGKAVATWKQEYPNTVFLVNGITVGGDIKKACKTLKDCVFVSDYMALGDAAPDILSLEFIRARTEMYHLPGVFEYTEQIYEEFHASELRKLPEKFREGDKIVLVQWDTYLSQIWQLTMLAYIEQLGLVDRVIRICFKERQDGFYCTSVKKIKVAGSHHAYCELVCNKQSCDVSGFGISKRAVACYLDVNSDDGILAQFLLKRARWHDHPGFLWGLFARKHSKWGLGDGEFIRVAFRLLSPKKECKALCKTWKKTIKRLYR